MSDLSLLQLAVLAALPCAGLPAMLFVLNLFRYRPPRPFDPTAPAREVSVLIPARNEEPSIEPAVRAALASKGVTLEVVVLDDHSTDRTADIVRGLAAADPRVRLESAPPLPAGWCGKQHACWVLAGLARYPTVLFQDADVRLEMTGLARLLGFLDDSRAALVSGVPRQETGTLIERAVIPLIHFLLLGFLPMGRMRRSTAPAYAAGCGQLFLTTRESYRQSGGHRMIRASRHDGLTLPRAYRAAGLMTDMCDATGLASCRMYRTAGELWSGLTKNATEGLAAPALIVPASVILLAGQVLPFALALATPWAEPPTRALILAAVGLAWLPRWIGVWRFGQPWLGAQLHPVGILVLLAIQWDGFQRRLRGKPENWRGRVYETPDPAG